MSLLERQAKFLVECAAIVADHERYKLAYYFIPQENYLDRRNAGWGRENRCLMPNGKTYGVSQEYIETRLRCHYLCSIQVNGDRKSVV